MAQASAAQLTSRPQVSGATGRRKVFQVIECGGPGGTGMQVAAICNGIDPARFETTLVYAVRPGSSAKEYRELARGAEQAVFSDDLVREISPVRDGRAFWALYKLFRARRPDVVHAHSSKVGVLARLAAFFAGVPVIYYSPRGYSFQMRDRAQATRRFYRVIEWICSCVGEVVAISPSEAELARPLTWGKPVRVVADAYLGDIAAPDQAAFSRPDRAKGEPIVIGACGRMTFARNPEAFVKLAQRVTDSRNGVRFAWIGAGELEEKVRELVRDMNLTSRFEVTGWLPQSEVQARMRQFDVFVHFSRWEGLPNSVLAAMAAGLPVIASDIAGNKDAVQDGENGFLVKDEIELLERTLSLVDDQTLAKRLGHAGYQRVKAEFTLKRMISALQELYSR